MGPRTSEVFHKTVLKSTVPKVENPYNIDERRERPIFTGYLGKDRRYFVPPFLHWGSDSSQSGLNFIAPERQHLAFCPPKIER
jgi:hypothetical protein